MSDTTNQQELIIQNLSYENDRLRDALKNAANRFDDLGSVIQENGVYQNSGFMRASAQRCMNALQGQNFND